MKRMVKMLVASVLVGGVVFGAGAQIILHSPEGILLDTRPSLLAAQGIRLESRHIYMGGQFMTIQADVTMNRQAIIDGILVVRNNTTINGNLTLIGNLNGVAPKHFIHPHPTDDSKVIRYIAIESAEALTLARGTARTTNGEAVITLPEHFSMVTSKDETITVNLTPEGAPVLLYVKQKSRDQITVAMKKSDFAEFRDVEFSFQVTGVRDGFEKVETIISVDDLEKTTLARDDVQKRIDALGERVSAKYDVDSGDGEEK